MNAKDLPYEELIGAAIALGVVRSVFEAGQMNRQQIEERVEREANKPHTDYGEFDFR